MDPLGGETLTEQVFTGDGLRAERVSSIAPLFYDSSSMISV